MKSMIFGKGHNVRRLRLLIAMLFVALVTPTLYLIWQANSQLKWEAFHQSRNLAEELMQRVDRQLIEAVRISEDRSFSDFSFLKVSGDPTANFLQRSPLSTLPLPEDIPGVVGYFQVDPNGVLSTPLLPQSGTDPTEYGIGQSELIERQRKTTEIQRILADNSLVKGRLMTGEALSLEEVPVLESNLSSPSPASTAAGQSEDEESSALTPMEQEGAESDRPNNNLEERQQRDNGEKPRKRSDQPYSQNVFDELNRPGKKPASVGRQLESGDETKEKFEDQRRDRNTKIQDLGLDDALQKKSASNESKAEQAEFGTQATTPKQDIDVRARRKEQASLPAPQSMDALDSLTSTDLDVGMRISTFESEIDPYEFSLLDSGHLVLFRKVWREGERFIQGVLIDQKRFLENSIESEYRTTSVSEMTNLFVAYRDDVVEVFHGGTNRSYTSAQKGLEGALLYRSRLSAPLDSLELIFSINQLPPGPGATALRWTSIIIALVFCLGFFALYRLGLSQIKLVRQQQDFVSAVSHELKTPLTSIRMYGEMLMEGWVDDEKRNQYYQYIQDESERLSRLISNVLRLSGITRNENSLNCQTVSVSEVMNQLESRIHSQAEQAGFVLNFHQETQANSMMINLDQDCFAQIIINLVDNAIKFSKDADNKTLDISSKVSRNDQIQFSVRDYGPGIPQNQLKKIFQLFYRPESELTRETVGTGIGLAIVHQLTTAMNGQVDVINQTPGVEFTISFPIQPTT